MDFAIPSTKDDLLSRKETNQYCVEEILTIRQIPPALQAFKSACRGNPDCIAEHFDTLFSILCVQKDLDPAVREDAWTSFLKGCQTFYGRLTSLLDEADLARQERLDGLNGLKMSCYLLCQFMELFDGAATRPSAVVMGKGRGKKTKALASSSMDLDWDYERQQGVQVLLSFIQLSLNKLWDPPVAEEEFVSLVSTCVYKLLENPSITKVKETITGLAHILGHLIKRYNHGLGASLKIDQLLKHFDFLTSPLVQMVEIMVNEHGCRSTVSDILREIGNWDTKEAARDTGAAKAYAAFLVELAEKLPNVALPSMPLVVGHLDGESYTMRNGVLAMMGEILTKYLCKEELDDKQRAARDGFFEKLEDHIHDVNAFVRSKVLQIWLHIVTEKCLPLLRQESVMTLVVGRLNDKSSIVRRYALQLVTALLKSNPFAAQLPVEDLRVNYEKEKDRLAEMTPEPSIPVTPSPADDKLNQEWSAIESEIASVMTGQTGSLRQVDTSTLIGDEESSDQVLDKIVKYLDNKEWLEAVGLTVATMESFPDLPVFKVLKQLQHSESEEEDDDDKPREEETNVPVDYSKLPAVIKEIYFWVKQPLPPHTPDTSTAGTAPDDQLSHELAKQQTLVQYLKNSLTFALQVQQCIPVICQLLGSKNSTDVLEAIQFFVTAVEFGVSAASVGVRRMMVLVWSQETTVRDAVVDAYRTLYLEPKEKNQRSVASSIVKNLSALVIGPTCGDLASMETLVSEFVKSGHIGSQVIQALWERFTRKSESFTAQNARAAIRLLAMCAQAEPDIVKSNIEVLIQEGLGFRAETDCLLALGTCQALLKLTPATREKGKPPPEPFRLPADHELFNRLEIVLTKCMADPCQQYWIPLADQVITVIYKLSETPDLVCARLSRQLVGILKQECEDMPPEAGDGESPERSNTLLCMFTRILSMAGQVAFSQAVFMEVDILTEIKRRQALREENKTDASKKNKRGSVNSAKGSRSEAELEEEMALAGASAEDTEAEYIRKLCELEIVSGDNFLSSFYPVLVAVCSNTAKFRDPDLQTAASLALARFMIVSSQFCESQLQLLFTLLEKSPSAIIRSNLIIALGDLTFRFPNLIEPWTSHLYARLRDESPLVRKTTLQVLTHLILNDMVKVKGQISELATCIVDPDERIAGLAKLFFHELSKKGNSMYNMPDIISRLSDPDIGVEEENFHTIIKYIFSHIEKSKHCETLAEKLCHRFRAARTERQVRDLSFCLSQLSYTEKGLNKLTENLACFADKLVDNEVYGHFCHIISKSRQFIRPEAKTALEEFEHKLEQAHTKGLQDGDLNTEPSRACEATGVKGKGSKSKTPGGKKNKKANKENINEDEDEDEVDAVSPYKPRRGVKGRQKNKPRFTFDSDEENDEELFDLGTEGELERDLDEDDSLVTKPSIKKSKRGKVALTPVQSPAV